MKIRVIITFLLSVSLFSCQDDNDSGKEKIAVRIGAGIDSKDCLYSRANSQGDEEVTRCLVEIVMDGESQGIQAMEGDETNGFTLNANLYKGKSYDLYFWADQGSDFFNASDLTAVSLVASQKPTVAYHGKHSFVPSEAENTFTETLTHAVAKVSYVTTTNLQSGKAVSMNIPRVYPTFDVSQGKANGTSSPRNYSITLSDDIAINSVVFSEYAFVDNEVQDVALGYTYAPTVTVTNAPIATNVHTTLTGDISNQTTIGVKASISSSWASEFNQSYDEEEEEVEIGIDMGGTVLWAPCNLGAENPEEIGNFYKWGSLTPHVGNNTSTNSYTIEKDNNGNLKPEYDAAAQNAPWRMPTKSECEELLSYTITYTMYNNKNGYKIKSNSTDNELFFPVSSLYNSTGGIGNLTPIWSSSSDSSSSSPQKAYCLFFDNTKMMSYEFYYALPIRPVKDKPTN